MKRFAVILAGCGVFDGAEIHEAVLTLLACSHPSSPAAGSSQQPTGIVVLQAGGRTVRVPVELARSPAQRTRGLMFRHKLPEQQGMLFLFDEQEVQSFWMQNTYIPLDMIFINEQMQIVGVVENAEPLTTTPRRVEAPSRYVLEVNAGFCRRNRIGRGTRVVFEGVR